MPTIYFAVPTAPGSVPLSAFLYVIIRFIAWRALRGALQPFPAGVCHPANRLIRVVICRSPDGP